MRILLDDSVISKIDSSLGQDNFFITIRQAEQNPKFRQEHPEIKTIPSVARFGHSTWGSGEVWGNAHTTKLANELLMIAAHQKHLKYPAIQTAKNQRDDADLIVAAILNKCDLLISDDKKFMLKEEVKAIANEQNLTIMSSAEYLSH